MANSCSALRVGAEFLEPPAPTASIALGTGGSSPQMRSVPSASGRRQGVRDELKLEHHGVILVHDVMAVRWIASDHVPEPEEHLHLLPIRQLDDVVPGIHDR